MEPVDQKHVPLIFLLGIQIVPSRKSKALLKLSMIFVSSFRIFFTLFNQRLVDQVPVSPEEFPSLCKRMYVGENQKDQIFLGVYGIF